ncbi:ferric reductase-like transmembrane domain-containing protein [Alicyclobacillus ferrooxydans]|uniref:ferric reductase-like transmembrane domain-containing protein n=1 Tax=Alicyclobacillus ferrooxydans TaxID=471514 RepID=UPI0006D56C03|nr:ferric reductase-like transmembrane domain-containing protein [Alicyclobacillus ferrooxydans]
MELVHERQVPAMTVSALFLFLVITGSYGYTHLFFSNQPSINQFYWMMDRSAGLVAYELLAFSVVLGLTTASSMWDRLRLRRVVTQLHQFSALLTACFVGLHLWGLHLDQMISFPWPKLLIPLASDYRPFPTALGVLTLYGLIALIASSMLRERVGVKAWRTIHFAYVPMFILVTFHGMLSGTDSTQPWAIWFYAVPFFLFIVLMYVRVGKYKATLNGKSRPKLHRTVVPNSVRIDRIQSEDVQTNKDREAARDTAFP